MTKKPRARLREAAYHYLFNTSGVKKQLRRARPSSFPFLSGDTFRALADYVFEKSNQGPPVHRPAIAFCSVEDTPTLASRASNYPETFHETILLVHNGDILANAATYEALLRIFRSVFSVNVTPELTAIGVRPLPIGLENAFRDHVGKTSNFPLPSQRESVTSISSRPIDVISSFRTSTNPAIREPLKSLSISSTAEWIEPTRNIDSYFSQVRQARFVLSPPGNGLDCHRTWESMYLGAIPVVLRNSLPLELTAQLPMLLVDDYESFMSLGQDARLELGLETWKNVDIVKLYAPHWLEALSMPVHE